MEKTYEVIIESIKELNKRFLSGELSHEEYLTAKALVIANEIGCGNDVAMMMATCVW